MTDEGTITGWIEVADSAQVLGGKLYALGLGWDSTVPGVPTAVVFKVGVPWALTNTPHLLEVRLEDIDGHIVFALEVLLETLFWGLLGVPRRD